MKPDWQDLEARLLLAVRQAGMVAEALRGRVENVGKAIERPFGSESAELERMRSAKSIVDEVLQELVLVATLESNGADQLSVDAEEDTPSVKEFRLGPTALTLVIDPIDGTLAYLSGRTGYSVSVAVIDGGLMRMGIVLFPSMRRLYYLPAFGIPTLTTRFNGSGIVDAVPLEVDAAGGVPKVVYVNDRVPIGIQRSIRTAGFEVVPDSRNGMSVPTCLIDCIEGRATAYVAQGRQVRDVILAGIMSETQRGQSLDWMGEPLRWPAGGRISEAIFSPRTIPDRLIDCLVAGQVGKLQ